MKHNKLLALGFIMAITQFACIKSDSDGPNNDLGKIIFEGTSYNVEQFYCPVPNLQLTQYDVNFKINGEMWWLTTTVDIPYGEVKTGGKGNLLAVRAWRVSPSGVNEYYDAVSGIVRYGANGVEWENIVAEDYDGENSVSVSTVGFLNCQ